MGFFDGIGTLIGDLSQPRLVWEQYTGSTNAIVTLNLPMNPKSFKISHKAKYQYNSELTKTGAWYDDKLFFDDYDHGVEILEIEFALDDTNQKGQQKTLQEMRALATLAHPVEAPDKVAAMKKIDKKFEKAIASHKKDDALLHKPALKLGIKAGAMAAIKGLLKPPLGGSSPDKYKGPSGKAWSFYDNKIMQTGTNKDVPASKAPMVMFFWGKHMRFTGYVIDIGLDVVTMDKKAIPRRVECSIKLAGSAFNNTLDPPRSFASGKAVKKSDLSDLQQGKQ